MKKTLFRALCLSFALVFCFLTLAACGDGALGDKTPAFNEIYKDTPLSQDTSGYYSHKIITALSGATDVKGDGVLVSYKSESGVLSVYNTERACVVLELPASETATSEITLQNDLIRVVTIENEAKKTTVYSDQGTLLASAAGKKVIDAVDDGFIFAGKLYRVKDDTVDKTFTIPPFVNLEGDYSESYRFAGDYLIHTKENDSVVYYNESFDVVARYQIPRDGIFRYDITVLNSGKLFVWYEQYCDSLSSDYDYHVTDYLGARQKVCLFAEVFDPVEQKVTAVELEDIRIDTIWEGSKELEEYECFTEAVSNIFSYQKVVEGNVDYSRTYYVLMDDDGEFGASLDNFFEGQTGVILPLNSSYYYGKTATGYAILDTKGTVLREVPAIGDAKEYGYLHKKKIYDHEFNLAVNLADSDIIISETEYDAAVLYFRMIDGERQCYIYNKSGEHLVTALDGYQISDYNPVEIREKLYYARLEPEGGGALSYGYYAFDGTLLFHAKFSSVTFITDCFVSYQDLQGDLVYALLS